jgi:predicted deacylase
MPLSPYRSSQDRQTWSDKLAQRAQAQSIEIGRSVEGRPITAYRVPSSQEKAPKLLCAANIHGVEYIATEVALGFFAALTQPQSAAFALREKAEIWIVPTINPDAYHRVWLQEGKGTLAELRTNQNGVDLNRNFPRPINAPPSWLPGTGSDRPGKATYRGREALSEPEALAMSQLFKRHHFVASSNHHSFMGTLIPARTKDPQDYCTFKNLCRAFTKAQPHNRYMHLASRFIDAYAGEQEDHQYHAHRTWAICVESFSWKASLKQHLFAPSLFWRFNPYDPKPWVDNDVAGVCAFFEAALKVPQKDL